MDSIRMPGTADDAPRVIYDKQGHVAYVTINRPRVLNALDLRTHEELAAVWDDFERDDDMWVAVLTGAGSSFSSGQDLRELAGRPQAEQRSSFGSRDSPGWPRLTERFLLSKPVVAVVRGFALGGGFELALACDVILAADDAEFGLPEARLGLIAGAGGVFRLLRQLPTKTATGYLITGRRLPANRAYDLGLVNEAVPAEELDECVNRWVQDILRCAPLAVRAIKDVTSKSMHLPLEQAFTEHYEWEERRRHSRDAIEGPRSFVEKRPPHWSGS